MIYRDYGKTGKKVSILGFGGMRFGAIDDTDACVGMMVEAAQAGVNYFDTAPGYFGLKSEEVFGKGFTELRRRSLPFYSSTKTMQSTEKGIRTELDAQLKRLGLDAVDFYHIWCITSPEEWQKRKKDGVLETFRKLKDEKLIRHVVVSSHLIGDGIKELLMEGVFEGVLLGYSAYNFNAREKAFEAVSAHKLGCVVMNPLGGGIIPDNPSLFEFLRTSPNQSVVEAALNFLFSNEKITCALVGFADSKQIQEAVKAVWHFTPVPETQVMRIKQSLGETFAELCTGCGYCDSCPEGIPIPKMMDAYNHKKLYKTDAQIVDRLHWHWNLGPQEAAKCTQCAQCEELCTQHLQIMKRMQEISRIGGGK
jgi:predicted aldo/keto reductase-like oxidoreductase